jgi:putative membrane protein
MTRRSIVFHVALATAVLAAASIEAPGASELASGDRAFIDQAAHAGMEEVALGQRAERDAASPAVRAFATRMVGDHEKANAELRSIAARDGFQLPQGLDTSARKELAGLQTAHGAKLDAKYMEHQASDHRKVITAFEREAHEGRNADVRKFAADTLPTLRAHLELARSTEAALPQSERVALAQQRGLDAAKDATGRSRAAAERSEHMPVAKTGM